jgi:hypothetical protein
MGLSLRGRLFPDINFSLQENIMHLNTRLLIRDHGAIGPNDEVTPDEYRLRSGDPCLLEEYIATS